jgi:hypothetical protein
MFRAIFQFVPSRVSVDGKSIIDRIHLDFHQVSSGFWIKSISDDLTIQVDSTGNVRYVFHIENIENDVLLREFKNAIENIFMRSDLSKSNFQPCLTLEGDEVVSEYIEQNEVIRQFCDSQFNDTSWEYQEMDDDRIKVSFRPSKPIQSLPS